MSLELQGVFCQADGVEVHGIPLPVQLQGGKFLRQVGASLQLEVYGGIVDGGMKGSFLIGEGGFGSQVMIGISPEGGGSYLSCEAGVGAMDVESRSFYGKVGGHGSPLYAILEDGAQVKRP